MKPLEKNFKIVITLALKKTKQPTIHIILFFTAQNEVREVKSYRTCFTKEMRE